MKFNNNNKTSQGFTLIELIITVAIIAILSATILFSIIGYVNKGRDADIKSNLAIFVSSGEIWYNANQSYEGFCGSAVVVNARSDISVPDESKCSNAGICCYDDDDEWAACAYLMSDTNYAYCVDSRGVKREINSASCTSESTILQCPSS
jgi:prepilin-type N-terminal cleavage/methylation domain-containing protein